MVSMAAIVSCILLPGACGPEPPPAPPVPDAKFAAVYERSGGLRPAPQKAVISPGRRAAVTALDAEGRAQTERFRLPVRKLHQFRASLSQPQFAAYESSPDPGNCADCFLYTLRFRGHSVSFTQVETPRWIGKTIGRFEALVENHLPRH